MKQILSKWRNVRCKWLTRPIFSWAKGVLPSLSDTEREALDAGEVWWDAELFAGNPNWKALGKVEQPKLTDAEQAFLDGPCEELCALVDDWKINHETGDLPQDAWDYLKKKRFFGMIIPEQHGGHGFSAFAHSEVVKKVSTRSLTAGVTVMVPNSLGPGELLLQFGTTEQQENWLPRLATGEAIPAFALTSEEAGSDAASMVDEGVIEYGTYDGEEVLGLRLNWAKRYITLGPIATVLGLAVKVRDPDGLVNGEGDLGITCVLVPTDEPGVETGRRHIPCGHFFQNGPTEGHDVFVPLENVIGGRDGIGHGWKMLMSALAAGRGISLPSQAAGAAALAAHSSGAYARVRRQFGLPVGKFEGVQARLGRLASEAYALDAARRLTCAGLDEGRALAVISGIMKAHATYRMRDAMNDAMDIHGGKTVIDGPRNYLGPLQRGVPIGITVEGANILTRNLIIYGQGAIRCHPHLLNEMLALEEDDEETAIRNFDRAFWAHVGHAVATFGRAVGRAWTGARIAPAPKGAGPVARHYRRMSRYSAAFALSSELALLALGGSLKRREMISARLGDMLSELYFLSAVLKRWEDEGRQKADLPLVHHAAEAGFARLRTAHQEIVANFPAAWVRPLLRAATLPGGTVGGPSDDLTRDCAELLLAPSDTRDRIVAGIHRGCERDALRTLDDAFDKVIATSDFRRRLKKTGETVAEARESGTLTPDQADAVEAADAAVAEVVAVDDFAPDEVLRGGAIPPKPTKEAAE
jgi:acyl-CoA dehydrogenase